jgi:transposase
MKVTTVGIDLAKNVFQVHGVNEHGKPVLKKQLKRDQLVTFFVNVEPCLIGMEAGGGAHHWARKLQGLGHEVRLMAPQFVKPYVKSNKNDAADAEAICEAVARPNMRFVPIKNIEQQSVLALHRVRQGLVKARTAQGNQIRGLLAEFGLVIPVGLANIAKRVPELIEDASNELTGSFRLLVDRLMERLKEIDKQVKELELLIRSWHRTSDASRKLEKVPGIGPITASALVATIGDAKNFDNGRQVAAWLGLVPRQHSSGGKANLQGISKRGDTYLRTLLVQGARSVILSAAKRLDATSWLHKIMERRNTNVAAIALANKNARTVWALLVHDREFRPDYSRSAAAAKERFGQSLNKRRFPGCSGEHAVMARQVRPWLIKPAPVNAPRVQHGNGASTNRFHQGQRATQRRNQSPDVQQQSLPSSWIELVAWHRGVHVPTGGRRPLAAIWPRCPRRESSRQ